METLRVPARVELSSLPRKLIDDEHEPTQLIIVKMRAIRAEASSSLHLDSSRVCTAIIRLRRRLTRFLAKAKSELS